MAFMVEDLLVAARADFGRIKVRSELVDLGSAVDQVVSALSDQLDGHTLTVDIEDSEAIGDGTRVGQIIRNLVTNAGRYGGPAVVITTRTRDGLSTVEVADNGPPIPDDERELIFQPYERSTVRTAHPNSIGLGLSVCRKLARLMGGNVEYHHDGWSRFVLTLPAAPGVESEAEPVETPA